METHYNCHKIVLKLKINLYVVGNINIKIMLTIAMHLAYVQFFLYKQSNYMDNINVSYSTVNNVKSYILEII